MCQVPRDELELHRAIPGLLAKSGAESVYAVGLETAVEWRSRSAMGTRARPVAMAGVLKRLGFDHETLDAQVSSPVLGGARVGEIRPCKETLAELGALTPFGRPPRSLDRGVSVWGGRGGRYRDRPAAPVRRRCHRRSEGRRRAHYA